VVFKKEFAVALALALVSGASALAHQLVWTRRLVDVLGANADTFSKVVGAFFAGLAVGAWIASRRSRTGVSFWRRVALAEALVALLALPILSSAQIADWLSALIDSRRALKLLLPLSLIAPPAVAMGAVIPWMIRALAPHDGFRSNHPVWLYATNTLGGVLGIAFVLLEGLPRFGLAGAALWAVAGNMFVAAGALLIPRIESTPLPAVALFAEPRSPSFVEPLLAFASGFAILAAEVVLQHQFAQVTINSLFSSALVLVIVLLALTTSAALTPRLVRWSGGEWRLMSWALFLSSLLCAVQPFLLIALRGGLNILPYELEPLPYTWQVVKLGVLAACPMLIVAGLVFPLLLRAAAARESGRRIGMLLAWNGLGGLVGAELGQAWLGPMFGLWGSMLVLAAFYGLLFTAGAVGWLHRSRLPSLRVRVTGIAITFGALAGCGWFARTLPQVGLAEGERLAEVAVGREGVVATVERNPADWRMLFNNSYTLGGSQAQFNQERQGLLPLLLHGRPKSVATLGVATGSTVAGAALHPRIDRIHAVELSPLVLEYADRFFTPYNRDVFRDPRVQFIQEDARWMIAAQTAIYDVVVGDLFLPWRTGEGRLFTLEHFANVRRSLKPGGLFCQWLPCFQLTRPQFETIARTFRAVFPDAFLVRGDFYSELPVIGVVGGRSLAEMDWARIDEMCRELRSDDEVTDPLLRHADGVAMLVLGPLPDSGPGVVNTLANGWLEWDAGRNILGMKSPWFIGVPYAEFVRDVHRSGESLLPPRLRSAHDAGQYFLTLEVAAKLKSPAFANLRAQATDRTPASLRDDRQADWRQWPMRLKPRPAQ
jgi:spermidine synthase